MNNKNSNKKYTCATVHHKDDIVCGKIQILHCANKGVCKNHEKETV